jgi:hypothetical protein
MKTKAAVAWKSGAPLSPIFYSLQVPPLAKLLILLAADACAWIL